MSDQSVNLALPFIMRAQAQKHVTHNEALQALDAIVQLCVVDRDRTVPPAAPSEGDRHIVGEAAAGDWQGRSGTIAAFQAGGWRFYEPGIGWLCWVAGEALLLAYDGAAWTPAGTEAQERLDLLGINADADEINRLAVKSAASLFDNAGAGHQMKLNKAGPQDTASLLFQTGYSGRAEIGTTGTDALAVKVSADGTVWRAALTISPETGNVGLGISAPIETLHLKSESAFCSLRLERANTATRMRHFNGGAAGLDAIYDIDPLPGSPTAAAEIRYFRNMNTSAPSGVRILRGNGTASVNTYLGANADSFLNVATGNVGVGTGSPTAKLHVNGALRVGSFALNNLPDASTSGAGSIAFVPNGPAGPALAFSDGTAWRVVSAAALS